MVAISDICGNVNANGRQTAALVQSLDPDFIIAAGDAENSPNATIADYSRTSSNSGVGDRWCPARSIRSPANHEYNDPVNGPGAEGYRAYFPDARAPATGPLYCSFSTRATGTSSALDTGQVPGGGGELRTIELDDRYAVPSGWSSDLASDSHTCDIAYGHHSRVLLAGDRWSRREVVIGWIQSMVPAWRQEWSRQAWDLYFSGHDADYEERFPAMDGNGNPWATGDAGSS